MAVGIILGLGVLVYFVFVHSEGTIDAPKITGDGGGPTSTRPATAAGSPESPHRPGSGEPPVSRRPHRQLPVVKVIGGAPPTGSGPKKLEFRVGEKVRFEIDTDEPFSFEIRGLDIKQSIEGSSTISFKAQTAGQFPVIASATLIGVADLLIKKKKSG
jgi:hypothetical protein